MKKTIILFTILFFFNPSIVFSKNLVCSHIWNGELTTFEFDLKVEQSKGHEVIENDENILLIARYSHSVYVLVYNKKSNKFKSSYISIDKNPANEGTCRLIR